MYAERKGMALQSVEVRLSHGRVHSKDCEECETQNVVLDEIHYQIDLKGNIDMIQRNRLLEIATRCPMHRTLTSTLKIKSELICDNNS